MKKPAANQAPKVVAKGPAPKSTPPPPVKAEKTTGNWDASKYTHDKLSIDQVNKIKQCFDIFDTDKSGNVSITQLTSTIKALGLEKEAEKIFNIVTAQTDVQELTFELWLKVFGFDNNISDDGWSSIFAHFDGRGTGCFNTEDFARACESVGERFTDLEYEQMIEYADKDHDGGINFQEFMSTITRAYPKV